LEVSTKTGGNRDAAGVGNGPNSKHSNHNSPVLASRFPVCRNPWVAAPWWLEC